ncbi:MAG: phosphatase PAP2 family protein [Pseudorhodobacter sp.]|nr:phosphatase PAP2 family protein [Pseudorhodobacter sp.]
MTRYSVLLVLAGAAVLLVFGIWPWLDLWATGFFYDPERGFPLAQMPLLQELRQQIWNLSLLPFALALPAVLLGLVLRRASILWVATRVWGFVAALYLLGPGLLVNALLKEHWGRARPADIVEFGGSAQFTPAWLPTNQCVSNCSFVSGEGAAVVALAISVLVVLSQVAPQRRLLRRIAEALLAGIVLLGAGMRVTGGRHFLSDTLMAAVLVALIAALLWRVLAPRAPIAPAADQDRQR